MSCTHLERVQFHAKDGICGGEEKQSVVRQVRGVHTQSWGMGKRSEGVWETAESSDTDREKMFNLAQCSTEALNLLWLLWKVKAGQHRMCWLTGQGSCWKRLCVCVWVCACVHVPNLKNQIKRKIFHLVKNAFLKLFEDPLTYKWLLANKNPIKRPRSLWKWYLSWFSSIWGQNGWGEENLAFLSSFFPRPALIRHVLAWSIWPSATAGSIFRGPYVTL